MWFSHGGKRLRAPRPLSGWETAAMRIGPHDLDQEVLVVAEIGNNHEGSYDRAERMIAAAAEAGVGAVKFQVIVPDRLVSVSQAERIRQLSRFQLNPAQFERLAEVARQQGVL